LESAAVGAVVFASLLFAAAGIAVGWDEGMTWERLDVLAPWLRQVFSPGADHRKLFSREVLDHSWRFSKEEPDGHGPLYAILSLAGHEATSRLLPPPLSYRVGSISLFAFAAACVYVVLRPRFGRWIALPTIVLLAALPRAVPEICFSLIDGPLLSLSLLTWCGFVAAADRPSTLRVLAFGLPWGLAMATKLTGWFFWAPYLAWCIWQKDRKAWKALLLGSLVALATVFILNVGWWPSAVEGVQRFFKSNLTRDQTRPIPIWFLGQKYDFSLPWYNTLVWTAIAVPPGTVLLGVAGLALAAARIRKDGFGLLLALNWGLIMMVRALPQAPGHDGTRQINISFAFLAILAGYAAHRLERAGRTFLARSLIILAAAASLYDCTSYHPFELSYYSPVAGGLAGAADRFEPTYFWDSLTPDVRQWLDEHTSPDRSVFFNNYTPSFKYLNQWRLLRARVLRPGEPAPPQWYVVQNRTAMLKPEDRWLLAHAEPAHRKDFRGVLLLAVYSMEQRSEAVQKVKQVDRGQ
jgi:hypothetical protein